MGWRSTLADCSVPSTTALGRRNDGTVVAVGDDSHGQCDVGDWADVRVTS